MSISDEQKLVLADFHAELQKEATLSSEKAFLDEACCRRYLVANKWKVEEAKKKVLATIKWRHEFGVDDILPHLDNILDHSSTGKMYVNGKDKFGHPVLYMHNARNEKRFLSDHEGSLRHLVYEMERAISQMGPGIEKMCIVMDFEGYSMFNAPPMKTSRATLDILSNHYPERMAASLMYSPPFAFWLFWKVISPFIDPVTKDKIKMISGKEPVKNAAVQEQIEIDQCLKDFGGENGFSFLDEETRSAYWKDDLEKADKFTKLFPDVQKLVSLPEDQETNEEEGAEKDDKKKKEDKNPVSDETKLHSEACFATLNIINGVSTLDDLKAPSS